MRQLVYFVVKVVRTWEFVEELARMSWVEKSHERITPCRDTKEEANKDFENLGFVFSDRAHVQCHDEINIGKSWTRHIVQCGLKQYNQ